MSLRCGSFRENVLLPAHDASEEKAAKMSLSTWEPDAFTRERGEFFQRKIPFQQGSLVAVDGEETQKPIPPAVQAFAAWIRTWPGIRSAGTRRSPKKPSTAGRRRDLHEEGRAVDAMIAEPDTPAGNAAGDALSNLLVRNADRLGVQGVVWRRVEWYTSPIAGAWEPYVGSSPHVDHPHIELSPAVLAWSGEEMQRRIADVMANPARPPSDAPPAPLATMAGAMPSSSAVPWILGAALLAAGFVAYRARRRTT